MRRSDWLWFIWGLGCLLITWAWAVPLCDAAATITTITPTTALTFEREIRPILKAHCFQCHGEDGPPKGGIDLRLRRLMLTNGEAGQVLVPGKPAESLMLRKIKAGEMPKGGKKLSADEIARLEQWIQQGAPTVRPEPESAPLSFVSEEDRAFWSFQPLRRPAIPMVRYKKSVSTPVDAFLLARLQTNHLHFAAPADRRTLIRRISYDLTGLPPTPEEVEEFNLDKSPDAYAKLVERLLASNRYGERWGRHWLDVAGYADSNGGTESDSERRWAWRYRDYVIRSLNADKPFDQFITEQLAGDELVSLPVDESKADDLDKLIATGFLRTAPDPTGDGPPDPDLARNQVVADTIQIVSSALLGLTVQCARCHDHRYDPIPQSDYYHLRAFFEPALDWKNWKNPGQRLVSLMSPEDRRLADCVEHAARVFDTEAQSLHDELIEKFVQKQLELVPEADRAPVMAARKTKADKRTEEHKRWLRQYPTFQDHIILGEINVEGAKQVEAIRQRATETRSAKPLDPMVDCVIEEPNRNPETHVFHRGDHLQPREKVSPGVLSIFAGKGSCELGSTNRVRPSSGRRLALARWMTSPANPLTPRVLVNRVWHHHFGTGLVPTTGDFGALGERPSHPELLDWLASEFVTQGWSLKALHRVIVLSRAYQQSSIHPIDEQRDPENRLVGRMRLRRLDSESLRDSLLMISGRLNETLYGAPVPVAISPQGQFVVGVQNKDRNGDPAGVGGVDGAENRRSIYVQVRRSMPVGIMETFDSAALSPNCEARPTSTGAAQALMLLNDQFVLERAADLADRLRREHPGQLRNQIDRLWRLAYAVEPTSDELQKSLIFLSEQTETLRHNLVSTTKVDDKTKPIDASRLALGSLCQAVLGSNRFLYVE